jgi:lipopolysaccharide export system permease protein
VSLLDRYVAREILVPVFVTLLFLTNMLLATQLVAQADVLLGSGVSGLDLVRVSLDFVPHFLGYVLPASFLLGGILGIARLSQDRETVALWGAGVSPWRLARTPLVLGAIVSALGLWLGFVVEPSALQHARHTLDEIIKKNLAAGVHGGVFYNDFPGVTLYAEQARTDRWTHVLLSDTSSLPASILVLADRGSVETDVAGGELRLVFEHGELHRDDAAEDSYATARFERLSIPIAVGSALESRNRLVGSPWAYGLRDMVERATPRPGREPSDVRRWAGLLHRRVASALAALAFATLVVAVGASARAPRAVAVSATVAAVIVHYLLLRTGETMARSGALPAALALELPNLALAAVGAVLLVRFSRRGAAR